MGDINRREMGLFLEQHDFAEIMPRCDAVGTRGHCRDGL
jgi:hypothetical protein